MRWRWWSWAEKVSAAAATAGSRKETVFVYFPYFSDAEHQSRQLAIDNSISTSYSYHYTITIAAATEGPTTPSRQTRHLTIRPSIEHYPSIDPILTRFLSRTPPVACNSFFFQFEQSSFNPIYHTRWERRWNALKSGHVVCCFASRQFRFVFLSTTLPRTLFFLRLFCTTLRHVFGMVAVFLGIFRGFERKRKEVRRVRQGLSGKLPWGKKEKDRRIGPS